jgi:O-antigen/teichoic acid export membrane protein
LISEIKRLAKHTGIYTFGNIAMRAGAVVLLPLYTHYLSVADFGILSLLSSISAIVSSFLGIGIAHATLRFYFEFDEIRDRNTVVSTALITTTAICLSAVIVLSSFSMKVSELIFHSKSYALAINITYLSLIFEMVRQVGLSYMRAREYSILFVVVSIVQLVVQVGCNVYFLAVLKMGVTGVVIGNTVCVFFGVLICTVIAIKECGIRYEFDKMKAMLKYSYPFLFSSITGVLLGNADRFILTSLFSLEAVGIYSLGLKFSALLSELIIEPFQRSFGAFRFSIMKQDNAGLIQSRTLIYLFIIVCWAGLGISVFSEQVINLLASPNYYGVVKYIPLILLAQVVGSCGYIFQTGILFEKDTTKLFYIGLCSGLLGVFASYPLIYFVRIYGACLALIGKNVLSVFMTYKTSQKLHPVDYDFKAIAYCLTAATGLYFLSRVCANSADMVGLLFKTFLCACFPFILYVAGIFTPDEKDLMFSFMEKAGLKMFNK